MEMVARKKLESNTILQTNGFGIKKIKTDISQQSIDNWYIKKIEELQYEKIDLLRLSDNGKPEHFVPPNRSELLTDVWLDIKSNGSRKLKSFLPEINFDHPKSIDLLKRILDIISDKNAIILDFFAGSGTTAHAVLELNKEDGGNRKCILVQLPEKCDEKSETYHAGYKTIADIAKERIRRSAKKINKELKIKIKELKQQLFTEENQVEIKNLQSQDLGFKVLKLGDSNFKQWRQIKGKDIEALERQMEQFIDPVAENATIENMMYELLLKSGKDLNSNIEAKEGFYTINENELIFLLEQVSQAIIDRVLKSNPKKVIALDKLFQGNDQLKTNTSLQMKDAGIKFETI